MSTSPRNTVPREVLLEISSKLGGARIWITELERVLANPHERLSVSVVRKLLSRADERYEDAHRRLLAVLGDL
jgi:hypothetical protein